MFTRDHMVARLSISNNRGVDVSATWRIARVWVRIRVGVTVKEKVLYQSSITFRQSAGQLLLVFAGVEPAT